MDKERFKQIGDIIDGNTILLPSNMEQMMDDIDKHFEEYKNYFKDDYSSSWMLDGLHNKTTIIYVGIDKGENMEKKDVCKECKYYERNAELEPCVSCKNLLSNNFERKQTEDFDYLGLIKKELESGGWILATFKKNLVANREIVEIKFFISPSPYYGENYSQVAKNLVARIMFGEKRKDFSVLLKTASEEFANYDDYTHKLIVNKLNECLVKVQE